MQYPGKVKCLISYIRVKDKIIPSKPDQSYAGSTAKHCSAFLASRPHKPPDRRFKCRILGKRLIWTSVWDSARMSRREKARPLKFLALCAPRYRQRVDTLANAKSRDRSPNVDRQADGPCRLDDDHSRARQLGAGFSPVIRHEARLWQTVVTMVGFGMGVALAPKTMRRAGDAEPMTARFMEVLHEAVRESAPT
nr:hypothetical protein [uncultured Ralstonia sp.]